MKKALLILSVISVHTYAQQIDTNSPYIWCEEEVVDTLKAVAEANQIKAEKTERMAAEISLLTSLQAKNRKIKSDEEKAMLRNILDRCLTSYLKPEHIPTGGTIREHYLKNYRSYLREQDLYDALEKGKIHPSFYAGFDSIVSYLTRNRDKIESSTDADFADYVNPLLMKMANVRRDNPYYADPQFLWVDKLNEYDKNHQLERKSVSYPDKDEYYTSNIYTQYKFRKVRDTDFRLTYVKVYDQAGKLVAVKPPYDWKLEDDKDAIRYACACYDYEHNAYGIDKETAAVKDYVKQYFTTGRTPKTRIDMLDVTLRFQSQLLNEARSNLRRGRISPAEYSKMEKQYNESVAEAEREAAAIRSKYPKELTDKAEGYIEQLKSDNSYPWDKLQATRIDGLNYMITDPNGGKLKAQLTFGYDAERGRIVSSCKVLEK